MNLLPKKFCINWIIFTTYDLLYMKIGCGELKIHQTNINIQLCKVVGKDF